MLLASVYVSTALSVKKHNLYLSCYYLRMSFFVFTYVCRLIKKKFDGNGYSILTVQDVSMQRK